MEPGSPSSFFLATTSSSNNSILIFVLGILIVLSSVYSASETALLSVNKIKLRNMVEEDRKGAKKVEELLDKQSEVLTTLLVANNVINISASAVATSVAITYTDILPSAVFVSTATLTTLILLFGEVIPKNLASRYAENIMIIFLPIITASLLLFKPIEYILNLISLNLMKIFKVDIEKKIDLITEDELKTMVNVSHEEGILEVHESKMINNIFEFGDQNAQDIMTPRVNMICVPVEATYEEIVEIFEKERFSRMPVFDGDDDNIIGILYIKDIAFNDKENFKVKDYIRETYKVYETKQVDEIFTIMKQDRISMTIVLDEYGETAGLLTFQDIIEEIFGELNDEDDIEEDDDVQQVNNNEFLVDGLTRINDLNDEIGTEITSEDFETIGGYIIGLVGDLPKENEEVLSEEFNLKFNIETIDKNRIDKLRLTILDEELEENQINIEK